MIELRLFEDCSSMISFPSNSSYSFHLIKLLFVCCSVVSDLGLHGLLCPNTVGYTYFQFCVISSGYMPEPGSFSPPRHPASPRFTSAAIRSSSPPRSSYHSPPRSSEPAYGISRSQLEVDTLLPLSYSSSRGITGQVHTTPPTKDYSSTTRYTSPSSGARR